MQSVDFSQVNEFVKILQRAGVQFVFRESLHDHVLTESEVALAMTDPFALRVKLSAESEADYRLFLQTGGQFRCRAINSKGHRCGNEQDLSYSVSEWVWLMQAGGYCDSHADRRVLRNTRKPIPPEWLETERPKVAGDAAMPKASRR